MYDFDQDYYVGIPSKMKCVTMTVPILGFTREDIYRAKNSRV